MPAPKKKRANFALEAPEAESVYVAGSFNDWDASARQLRPDKKGVWRTWMNLPPGAHEYLFVVDGEWREDPCCEKRAPNPYGSHNSVLKL